MGERPTEPMNSIEAFIFHLLHKSVSYDAVVEALRFAMNYDKRFWPDATAPDYPLEVLAMARRFAASLHAMKVE